MQCTTSNEFSDHLGFVDKMKKSMGNVIVKCPIETTTDQITGTDRQLRFIREQLKANNHQLEEIIQTKPPEYLSIKAAANRFDLTAEARSRSTNWAAA